MTESVFDTFDFTPVKGDPFHQNGSPSLAVQVADADRAAPAAVPDALGSSVTVNDPNAAALEKAAAIPTTAVAQPAAPKSLVGKIGSNIVHELAALVPTTPDESYAHYAANPEHPMPARIGSGLVEEARRAAMGLKNNLQTFIGPLYGQGHVPTFNEGTGAGTDYAGAGINLASAMVSPGGEGAVGAGWNPKALEYLKGLTKKKPPMLPETDAMVQHMIGQGPDYAKSLVENSPSETPGKGYASIATSKHVQEELAKPKPPLPSASISSTGEALDSEFTAPSAGMAAGWTSPYVKKPVTLAQPGTGLPVPAGSPAASGTGWSLKAEEFLKGQGFSPKSLSPQDVVPMKSISNPSPNATTWVKALDIHNGISAAPAAKVAKVAKTPAVKSTPLTAQQALFGPAGAGTDAQLNKLFSTHVPPLKVPTMKPYDPNVTGVSALGHETAPGTSGQVTPFNPSGLPMDQASVKQRMKDLGFGPVGGNWLYWRGVAQHGPYSWDSAAVGYKNPASKTNEPGLFLAPDANAAGKPGKPIAQMYGANVNAHVIRSENPLVTTWKKVAGTGGYSSVAMQKIIKDAWAKGHDALLLKDINDLGGVHDQMVVRNPNQLRHPHAAFDPKYKDLPNLLAARGLGVELPPIVAQDQEMGGE